MKFEWDAEKAEINLRKHDVSFEEAMTVFNEIKDYEKNARKQTR